MPLHGNGCFEKRFYVLRRIGLLSQKNTIAVLLDNFRDFVFSGIPDDPSDMWLTFHIQGFQLSKTAGNADVNMGRPPRPLP